MPNTKQVPAILELFRVSVGSYALRLNDSKDNYIAVKLAELIPDLETLQVITPTDMKVFRFNDEPNRTNGLHKEPQVTDEWQDPMDKAMEMAEENERQVAEIEEPKRGRGRPRKISAHATSDTCQRCRGAGQVQTLLEGGASATGTCAVCQGSGTVARFGKSR